MSTTGIRLTPMALRRLVQAADERAATADERAMVAQAYGCVAQYEAAGHDFGEYSFTARLVALLEPVATRAAIVAPRVRTVRSSDGHGAYRLERSGSTWRCSCPGHQHRGHCRHADEAMGRSVRKAAPVGSDADNERDAAGGSLSALAQKAMGERR